MKEALLVFSRKGEFKTLIHARDIASREDARKRCANGDTNLPLSPRHLGKASRLIEVLEMLETTSN